MSIYVVTGGAGFIGSHLATRIGQSGHEVRVLDSLEGAASRGRADALASVPHVEIIQGDICDEALCRRVLAGAEFVLHHAGEASVQRSLDDMAGCAAVNIGGTINLLEAARAAGTVRRFVFASSCAVYGDTPGAAKHEASLTDPLSPYASSKLSAEYFCRNFFRLYGLQTVSLRYFNVYGPGQDPAGDYASVIPKFVTAITRGVTPVLYGDGEQSRQHFVHGFLAQVEGIDFEHKVKMGIRNNRYDAQVPQVVAALRHKGRAYATEVQILQAHTDREIKFIRPGPETIVDTVADRFYNDRVKMAMTFVRLLEGKDVMVGVIDVASDVIETPEQIAETIGTALQFVPRDRLIPCTNCGLAPMRREVAEAKLAALGRGAALARERMAA